MKFNIGVWGLFLFGEDKWYWWWYNVFMIFGWFLYVNFFLGNFLFGFVDGFVGCGVVVCLGWCLVIG